MTSRFYAPDLRVDQPFVLPSDESAHATRVLRLGPGDDLLAFDGQGRQVRGRVERGDRHGLTIRPLGIVDAAAELAVHLTLAQAVLKSDAMDAVVRDATMMGVSAIWPLVSTRTNVSTATLARRDSADRWRRVAIASAKQCGRAVVPHVEPASTVEAAIRRAGDAQGVLLVEPSVDVAITRIGAFRERPRPTAAVLAIGPEGGWSADEIDVARAAGFDVVTLGTRTLRADIAGLVAIAVFQAAWDCLE